MKTKQEKKNKDEKQRKKEKRQIGRTRIKERKQERPARV
jgi:hypothetical protein